MFTKSSAIEYIRNFINECKKQQLVFEKIILFGSYATERFHEYSDIDLALVSSQFVGNTFSDWHLLSPINIKFSYIEPHPISLSDFLESDPFIDEIKRNGIELN